MPRIFDNIEHSLLPELRQVLSVSDRADFCVGYFNLRGWKALDAFIERWQGGPGHQCRLLVGMQSRPDEELRESLRLARDEDSMDNQTALRLKKRLAEDFREQLTYGPPTNEDEVGLRRLAGQLRAGKVVVKLFLRHPLHAKLYLCFRPDPVNPAVGYVGSSNLTLPGLSKQGELNVDVMDHDATQKLARWFEQRWTDHWCVDISAELAQVIEESWARETLPPPYHIYLKIAYHLCQEARAGISESSIPPEFSTKLLPFQVWAVKIAARHLRRRGGVLIGDVVGLGKTLMATAVARILQEQENTDTLIICPKNLVQMWEAYKDDFRLLGRVVPLSQAANVLPELRKYRVVIIDESHNLRNREGKRYRAIQDYIQHNGSWCILLSATPYNKTYVDLSNQLRLFVPEDADLGVRPERLLRQIGDRGLALMQVPPRSLAAFERSEYADDWRDLMRLYLVRRTRTFIKNHYAVEDPDNGRKYLVLSDGTRFYFPERVPRTVRFTLGEGDSTDQYARLYAPQVVDAVNALNLPRYGLGNYIVDRPKGGITPAEDKVIQDLSRGGKRLMGFCRTNLFKRLESSGEVFLQSLARHILRNYVYLHALENGLEVPIGTQDSGLLDSANYDEDVDDPAAQAETLDDGDNGPAAASATLPRTEAECWERAAAIYNEYRGPHRNRFRWLRAELFAPELAKHLRDDAVRLMRVLADTGAWRPEQDRKLAALYELLTKVHGTEKVIVFTQFADTVRYLERELSRLGVTAVAGVSGQTPDPTSYAWRFSPASNGRRSLIRAQDEYRVLIATDVLSEGQNLQDGRIIVNYDLPWAIIRLIQRAGRVDRIGQRASTILCYSFLPAEGVERLIRLRARVRERLRENAEVVGTDEAFFEDELEGQTLLDLYNERAGILDGEADTEVDLVSEAYEIWKNAVDRQPELAEIIPALPSVVYSARPHRGTAQSPNGVLVYLRTAQGNDELAWIGPDGQSVSESQVEILRVAECAPDTPAAPRSDNHHELVRRAVEHASGREKTVGGQLGRPSGARFRTYERLKRYAEDVRGTLWDTLHLRRAIDDIYRYPLRKTAIDTLNRRLREGIDDQTLAELVMALREEDRLCIVQDEASGPREPRIVCSLGLVAQEGN